MLVRENMLAASLTDKFTPDIMARIDKVFNDG